MENITPPGQQGGTQEKGADAENGSGNAADGAGDAASTDSARNRSSNFPDMGGTNQTTLKNLLTFGICMAVMLAVLFAVIFFKRRNRR